MSTRGSIEAQSVWVEQLLQRYTRAVASIPSPEPELLQALNTLQLTDAVLAKLQLMQSDPYRCVQIAIIGPTQSGKSTLVNVLLDCNAASISALAGFTVHAQGYAAGVSEHDLQSMEALMAPMHRTLAAQLDANKLDTYVLEPVSKGTQAIVDSAVVWDTPDFDSIESVSYKHAVLRTMGFADLLILTVSKDKYGDKSVWDMLALLHELRQPLLVCINKLDQADEETVVNAFTRRFSEQFDSPIPPVVSLPFIDRSEPDNLIKLPNAKQYEFTDALNKAQEQIGQQSINQNIQSFIAEHSAHWLSPLITEKKSQSEWSSMIDNLIEDAQQRYLHDYLNNPDKYDTFNRALAELLTLLEIPGIATALARTRQVVTWPARKLFGLGRTIISNKLTQTNYPLSADHTPDQEADILQSILDNTMTRIQGMLLSQPPDTYWISINQAFREQEARIREKYSTRSTLARQEFEPLVEAAAQRLYEKLQSQPALLNTLRATRVTADAAGVALALKSGGLAPTDLILAPAMFSATTLLTESALGKYLDSIKRELKDQQAKHISERVLHGVLGEELLSMSKSLDNKSLFTQQLEPELNLLLSNTA